MNKNLKGFYLIFFTLVISLLHLPFAFATSASAHDLYKKPLLPASPVVTNQSGSSSKSIYDSLQSELSGLSREAFEYAQKGWDKLRKEEKLKNESVLAIIDFSQPSSKKRLFVLDMENYKVLFNTLVAHGKNSGKEWAQHFSNKLASYKSSPGFYITGQTYTGRNGYSLKLTGLENGINDNAFRRAIVMHGAPYVSESYVASRGYIGRSQGCPAVPVKDAKNIINTISNGACLYIYTPDQNYFSRSAMLKEMEGV